jgi:hypothetical protein
MQTLEITKCKKSSKQFLFVPQVPPVVRQSSTSNMHEERPNLDAHELFAERHSS